MLAEVLGVCPGVWSWVRGPAGCWEVQEEVQDKETSYSSSPSLQTHLELGENAGGDGDDGSQPRSSAKLGMLKKW